MVRRTPKDWLHSSWKGYLLAIIAIGLAALLRASLPGALAGTPYLAFYPAVMAAAAFGGFGPGLLATIGSAICVDLWFDPTLGWIDLTDPVVLGRLAIFVAGGFGMSLVAGIKRAAQAHERQQAEELKRTAAEIAGQKELLGVTLSSIGDAVIVTDDKGHVTFLNGEAQRLTGWTTAEAQGQPLPTVFNIVNEQTRETVENPADKVLRLGMVVGLANHTVLIAKDGRETPIDDSGAPIRQADGTVHGVVLVFRDVTERRAADEAVRRLNAELEGRVAQRTAELQAAHRSLVNQARYVEALFQHALTPLIFLDREFNFIRVNEAYAQACGRAVSDFPGHNHFEFYPHAENQAIFEEVVRSKTPHVARAKPFEYPDHPEWGVTYWDWTLVPVLDAAGEVDFLVFSLEDVTARRRAEIELERHSEGLEQTVQERTAELAAANTAKDQFIAVLSHELRTPLTPVLAAVSLLQVEGGWDEDTRESLEMIRRNVELEARLIDDLLDVTRIARGKLDLNRRHVELCEVIRRAVEVCKADIEARQVHFGVDIGPDAPYWLDADPARLQQIFWNLLKNAIKFTPKGGCVGIRVRRPELKVLSLESRLAPHSEAVAQDSALSTQDSALKTQDWVVAEVNDSGVGIAPEALERIFDAFEQAERSRSRQFGGLGLGLTISKALAEMHGGTLEAHSEGLGRGASFRLRLPLMDVASRPAPRKPDALPDQPEAPARRLRILLVEDHGDTAQVMSRALMRKGYEVQTAGDVATALHLAGRESFDLLISDLGLPDRSGLDLIQELRSQGRNWPAIALSGYGQDEDVRRSREVGFDAHLTKPVNFEQLHRTMVTVIPE